MTNQAIWSGWALALACALLPAAGMAQDAGAEAAAPAAEAAPAPKPPTPAQPDARLMAALDEQKGADDEARASQQRVEALDDETQKLLSEYRRAVADAESYGAYAELLESQVRSQQEEMAAIDVQLLEVETTSREVSPLMTRMLDTLARFVVLDVPFLLEERQGRVKMLTEMMDRADVTISEKYRRIVEAYQVEMDYGRTIEAYEGKLGAGDDARTVNFLRVGRVALLYQSLDGEETGYWDANKKDWVVDDHFRDSFIEGVGVARKSRAPEILIVPVQAPKEARS